MVGSSCDGGDVLELRDKSRSALSRAALSEAQNTIIALLCQQKFTGSECGNLLGMFPSHRLDQYR